MEGEAVRCHQGNILHSVPLFRFLFFSQSILVSIQNDRGMEVIIMRGDVNRHPERM